MTFCGTLTATRLYFLYEPCQCQSSFNNFQITICHICQNIANEEQPTYLLISSMALCKIFAHQPYWDREQWKESKLPVTELCRSLAGYVEYLQMKNKRSKINHRSPTPIRELGENIGLKFLPKADKNSYSQSIPGFTKSQPTRTFL